MELSKLAEEFAKEELKRHEKSNEQFLENIRRSIPHETILEANRIALRKLREQLKTSELDMAGQLSVQLKQIVQQIILPPIDIRAFIKSISFSQDPQMLTAAAAAIAGIESMAEMHQQLSAQALLKIRESLSFDHAPMWAALHTMRTLKLERISSEFHEFIEETLEEIDTGDDVTRETTARRAEAKMSELAPYEQFKLTIAIAIFQTFITIFAMIQAGQPIKIDPTQIESFKRYPEIYEVLQTLSQATVTAYYKVERPVELKLRPANRSVTIGRVEPGEPVRLLRSAHKWIYVEYQDEEQGLPVRGWANKKYLNKQ